MTSGLAIAGPEKDPGGELKARVPADKRAKAKKNKSPGYGKKSKDATPEIIAEGKAIFEKGKGTCVNCHHNPGGLHEVFDESTWAMAQGPEKGWQSP